MTVRVEFLIAILSILILRGLSEMCPEPKRDYMLACIAECLNLSNEKICTVNYTTGGFIDENCVGNRPFDKTSLISDQKIMVCDVLPNNDDYLRVMKISDYNLCTHFHFGPWHVYNPVSKNLEQRTDNIPKQLPFKEYAQRRGVKTILSVGSSNYKHGVSPGNWSILAADGDARRKLVDQIINQTDELKFDALAIYWWYSGCPDNNCGKGVKKDKENLVLLMRELSNATKERRKNLFLIIPSSERTLSLGYNMPELSNYVDYFYVCTYNYEGTWNNYLGYSANLHYLKISMDAIKGKLGVARMNKVIGGFTSTVTLFALAIPKSRPRYKDPVYTASSLSHSTNILRACQAVQIENYSVILDGENCNLAHNTTHVYVYEDVNTLRKKIEFFKLYGLGGLFYSSILSDDDESKCGCGFMPVLRIAAEVLHGGGCVVKQCLKSTPRN